MKWVSTNNSSTRKESKSLRHLTTSQRLLLAFSVGKVEVRASKSIRPIEFRERIGTVALRFGGGSTNLTR